MRRARLELQVVETRTGLTHEGRTGETWHGVDKGFRNQGDRAPIEQQFERGPGFDGGRGGKAFGGMHGGSMVANTLNPLAAVIFPCEVRVAF